jgi:hypothetical protein
VAVGGRLAAVMTARDPTDIPREEPDQ